MGSKKKDMHLRLEVHQNLPEKLPRRVTPNPGSRGWSDDLQAVCLKEHVFKLFFFFSTPQATTDTTTSTSM